MKSTQLSEFPRLQHVLSPSFRAELNPYFKEYARNSANALMNYYSVFVDLTITQGNTGYSALDVRNDSVALEKHYHLFLGFIWKNITAFDASIHIYSTAATKIFSCFASNNNLDFTEVKSSKKGITLDIQGCIDEFNARKVPVALLEYYQGWTVKSKEGKEFHVHLASFHDTYGKELTDTVFNALYDYFLTQKLKTGQIQSYRLTSLLNSFTLIAHTKRSLEHNLQPLRSHIFFSKIMVILFGKSQSKGHDPKMFWKSWRKLVKAFTNCFIDTGVLPEPIKPILTPIFKEPKGSALTFSIGGKLTPKEIERWLVDIPLHIKDEESVEIIKQRLERDLAHIRTIAHSAFEDIKQRQSRVETYKKKGAIKPIHQSTSFNYEFGIGKNNLQNTVATFYHHGFNAKKSYASFLGFKCNQGELLKELSLPTKGTIITLVSLLVIEHPSITPSWLLKWELFDKTGAQVGFKQCDNQWVAVSCKDRRGAELAQQVVILNDYTKSIVETLIEHTQFAREYLKAKSDRSWRYMLLTANITQAYYRYELLTGGRYGEIEFRQKLSNPSYMPSGEQLLNEAEAQEVSQLFSLKALRKARGLQVYLETKSLHAVAESLGHKKVNILLLSTYLPKPLMDFFNARWVRQFQNAIVFEAMKDSDYLFDAIDIEQDKLAEFLENHGIGELPEHFNNSMRGITSNEKELSLQENVEEVIFTLSTALLQVLIAIQTVVENATEKDAFIDITNSWYESAVFILTSLNLQSKKNIDIIPLLEKAEANPINTVRFKELLLCH